MVYPACMDDAKCAETNEKSIFNPINFLETHFFFDSKHFMNKMVTFGSGWKTMVSGTDPVYE